MRAVKKVIWFDRHGVAHEGPEPQGPDDWRETTCKEHRVRDLIRAIGLTAPTCILCMSK